MKHHNKNKAWSDNDRKFIKENYTLMNNLQIAEKLGRTEDSVRKEFNKLHLKRPKKSDLPKLYRKRGRRKKIPTVQEAIQKALEEKKKKQKALLKEQRRKENEAKKIANEALWASDFLDENNNDAPPCRDLINPIVIKVPEFRAVFNIDSTQKEKNIKSKIAAISKKYGSQSLIIENYDM